MFARNRNAAKKTHVDAVFHGIEGINIYCIREVTQTPYSFDTYLGFCVISVSGACHSLGTSYAILRPDSICCMIDLSY